MLCCGDYLLLDNIYYHFGLSPLILSSFPLGLLLMLYWCDGSLHILGGDNSSSGIGGGGSSISLLISCLCRRGGGEGGGGGAGEDKEGEVEEEDQGDDAGEVEGGHGKVAEAVATFAT